QALADWAAAVRAAIVGATPDGQRHVPAPRHQGGVFELLRLQGTVARDPEGERLGRIERFSMDWEAAVPLVPGGYGDQTCLKVSMPAQATRIGGRDWPGGRRK